MQFSTSLKMFAGISAAAFAFGSVTASAEVTLTSIEGLPSSLELAQSYQKNFVAVVNKKGKGLVHIKFVGGPEVVPPRKAGDAIRRGQFDMLHTPTAYYIGLVPEGYALTLSTKTPADLRANGGWEILEKVWAERANAKLIAWAESGTQYNTYLTKKPEFTSDGLLTLKNFKMRVTGTYRPLFSTLGATTIGMKASEIYTGLQRGVVQGFGWPDVGIVALGLHKLVKYRIDPPFYHSNNTVTVNLDKWRKLSKKVQDFLIAQGKDYEKRSIAFMEKGRKRDETAMFKAGAKPVVLKGAAAKAYLNAANVAVWERLKKQSKYADVLQQKSFPDWTPPK